MDNPIYRQEERDLQLCALCEEVLRNAGNELYLNMRFLDAALSSLRPAADFSVSPAATDGGSLYYHPEDLLRLYRMGRRGVNRLYLHMILHCLFAHPWARGEREWDLWDLACDITVEYLLDHLYVACVHRPGTAARRGLYGELRESVRVVTAQGVFRFLERAAYSDEELLSLRREFCADDHSVWRESRQPESPIEQQRSWEDVRERMQTEMETFAKEASEDSRSLYEQLRVENRRRYDYKDFLRKFCVPKEELQVDMDAFDYIFYHYGMELYGNMPLIEPLETREVSRIEDFVIVIDTSMSCKGELVRRFLEETYSVLSEAESFSRRICVHLIQCDERVQRDTVITSTEQLKAYMDSFQVVGQGGTDFRPAFAYVDELLRRGAFCRLRGLVYFTDGFGIYPVKKPVYETAFVFMREDYQDVDVPPWAIKLIIDAPDYI